MTAKVRFDGAIIDCSPVRRVNGTDDWIVSSWQHAARLAPGTHFRVTASEIVSLDEFEVGVPGIEMGFSDVQTAMAKEREALPNLNRIIAENPPIAHDAPGKIN